MKLLTSRFGALAAIGLAFGFCGCSTSGKPAQKEATPRSTKGHYVTLPPETGSRLPRKVWVADDGTVSDPDSQVQRTGEAPLLDLQRKSGTNFKGGN